MKKKILLVTAGWFHPPVLARLRLERVLRGLPDYSFQHSRSLDAAPLLVGRGDSALPAFAAIVLYFHHHRIRPETVNAFEQYVAGGGGVLAVHSATASFRDAGSDSSAYFRILGGRFTGHGPVSSFTIQPVTGEQDPFAGIGSFSVTDELYLHALEPGIEVHFQAEHEGQAVPVVWTRHYGQGRVCYACPGHRSETLRQRQFQEILRRGLMWAAG